MKMPCETWSDQLVPYLDGELTPGERIALEAHLAQCSACARELESHGQLQAILFAGRAGTRAEQEAPRPRLNDVEFAQQVRRRVETRPRSMLQRTLFRLAAALVVSLTLLVAGFWGSRRWNGPPEELLGSLELLEALEAEGLEPTPELAQMLEDLAAEFELLDAQDIPWEALSEESL